ncbi:MAG TPA: hypothetical protein VD994_11730 [Prosthecobacter sp.]|nr:hypothetical protein [Prosthecobacter sp.]
MTGQDAAKEALTRFGDGESSARESAERVESGAVADLVRRLERATGPNFALEVEITRLVLPDTFFGKRVVDWFEAGAWFGCNTDDGYRHLGAVPIARYTSSLDAAVTLVPEGWRWDVNTYGKKPRARIESADFDCEIWHAGGKDTRDVLRGSEHEGKGKTPAIALCIAALKARVSATPLHQDSTSLDTTSE